MLVEIENIEVVVENIQILIKIGSKIQFFGKHMGNPIVTTGQSRPVELGKIYLLHLIF